MTVGFVSTGSPRPPFVEVNKTNSNTEISVQIRANVLEHWEITSYTMVVKDLIDDHPSYNGTIRPGNAGNRYEASVLVSSLIKECEPYGIDVTAHNEFGPSNTTSVQWPQDGTSKFEQFVTTGFLS